jgi:hypothetical protein
MSVRRAKQLAELNTLEAEFRTALIVQLRACAVDGTLLFNVSRWLPDDVERSLRCAVADELHDRAERILALRDEIGLPTSSTPAARFCEECRAHNDRSDEHRLGPRRRAQLLLAEVAADAAGRSGA